jgi:hypothetical protein
MKSKIITAIGATSLVFGMFALQGCYEYNYPGYTGYGYRYGSGRGYYSQPAVVGDYDEHHSWHDRDRDEDHHSEWRGHNERDEHEVHADRDHDHDRD